MAADPASGRLAERTVSAASISTADDEVVVAALPDVPPIEIEALRRPTVQIVDLEVAPLQIEAVRIDPLSSMPR